jgi:ankyrin repeat protein
MRGRTNYKRFVGLGLAIVLLAGLGVAIVLSVGRSQLSSSPRTDRAGDKPEAMPMAADPVTAIRNADAQVVRKLLDDGADVNARDTEGNTPLILASFYASPECVELLIERGADVNAANKAGATALIRAATDHDKTRLLVAAGASVRVRTARGNTPLILAARRAGNSRTVQLLLEHGADAEEHNNAGVGPVLVSAASGDLETVQLLLDAGAKADDFPKANRPNPADPAPSLRTPLMWAAHYNDVRMVRLLLERGADPNQSTYFGNPLSHACWHDSFEAAELLIAKGANVNGRDAIANFTPLHWAAGTEKPGSQLVKLLLTHGADPNAEGGEPVAAFGLVTQTPRLIAEKRGRTAIVDALAAAGAQDPPRAATLRVPAAAPQRALPDDLDNATLIVSTEKALAALQTTAAKSREMFRRHVSKQDCVSCHQQYLPMAAVGHARNRSVRFDQQAAREQIDSLDKLTSPVFDQEYIVQTVLHPDPAHTLGYHLFGLAAAAPPSAATDAMVHHLVTVQASDGRWFNNIPRPPMASCDVSATALAIHAIQRYGWPGRREEFASSVSRASRWLWNVKAETNEEAVFQLLGLHWAGEPAEKLVRSLQQMQRDDGGWAQLPTLESDAYATGEALYTLAQIEKDAVSDPAWQRGLRFLLERQEDDGTWHVARRTFPFQPTMDSGFPHHRDSWISAAATSWAVLALTQALPVGPASDKPAAAAQTPPAPMPDKGRKVDFAQQIKPLLERSCAGCHSGEKPRGLFRVEGRDAILKGGASGEATIVPGHSEKSPLIDHVSGKVPESEMPPKAVRERFPALTTDEVTLVRAWIDQGAEWPRGVLLTSPKLEKQR